ncbi:LPS assembly protein LptD [Thiomicrorhabdus sp. ZW0627]|uniref:LPS-assembly protein LptD n=1 Tax=Thiomicrorhabdus sp. ZW0627 TaxID=3039774 RepID=UPI0024366182|nr:LPS assembly protein LptD [Thiomicrorhabdus sp. ZW0627]MDG6773518.1 LPS assembly protein LptD [Thiomicrorhabdus sp. ZW0627]
MSNLIRHFHRLSGAVNTGEKRQFRLFRLGCSRSSLFSAGLLSLLATAPVAQAQDPIDCKPQWIVPLQEVPPSQQKDRPTELEADELTQPNSDLLKLTGSAVITQPGMVVLGDEILYEKAKKKAQIFGQVEFHREDILVTADQAEFDQQKNTAQLNATRYQIKPSRAHGHAKTIDLDKNRKVANLKNATFTTCPIQQLAEQGQLDNRQKIKTGKVAWELEFENLEINNNTRRVYGKNTVLFFHDIPVFYTPYFDFPLDDRASGLLIPEFGGYKSITDAKSSFYVKLPYYFNLAPNYDDTLTLMYMEQRGPVLENEFRYMQKSGPVSHSAELTLTALNDAKTADEGLAYLDGDNVVYGDTIDQRWRAKLIANQNWGNGFSSNILWHETSDENFFADIPVESQLKTVSSTPRYMTLNYRQDNLQAYAQVYSYLRLHNAPVNYEKRPEVGMLYNKDFGDLRFDLAGEATEFDVPLSSHTKPEALRTRLVPQLSYSLSQSYGHLKALAAANHLSYAMHDNGNNTTGQDSFDHTVMQYAVNGGLIFEREFSLAGSNYIQTLEPELQYLHVPYVDQSHVPLFDTTNQSLHFSNLFSLNRFSGYDRIGDTTQVSAALTSRILTESGAPFLEAGIGQIYYLADRKVTLTGTEPLTDEQSDYFVKLGVTTPDLYFYSTSQFSKEELDLVNANSRLRWNLSKNSKLLFNHTLTNNNLPDAKSTLAAGAIIKLSPRWEVGTYWNYDFTNKVRNEVQHALRYDDCCWAGEFSVEETQLENGLYNYSVQFQIEFKGLSSTDSSFKRYLSNKLNF